MIFKRISAVFLTLFVIASFAKAQDDEPIRIETNLVSVGVVVKDKNGNYVKDLKKEAFEIFDNNDRRQVEFFSAEDAPVSYGIIYDLHPTTSERTKTVLESLKKFTSELREKDDFFTVVFNERGSLNLDFVPSVEQIEKHLSLDEKDKPKSLYDAIYIAGQKIRTRENAKKTLIIISDGKDHNSHHTYDTLKNQLRSFNVQIYSIFLDDKEKWGFSDISLERQRRAIDFDNPNLERAAIAELSDKSGGNTRTPFLQNTAELLRIYNQIASEMHGQYSIGFYPNEIDGKWHKINVKVRPENQDKKLKLTYRKGYQSVSPKSK